MISVPKVVKGALLIAGTTIGGGMLAMPVLTSSGGFIPSVFLFVACWLFMAATGLLFLEICLWMEGDTNIISMAKATLGLPGQIFSWILYLFMFFTLTLAYTVICGKLTGEFFQALFPTWSGSIVFLLLFGPLIWAGAWLVGRVNVFMMAGLILSYLGFVYVGAPYVRFENLMEGNWLLSLKALPVAFAAFGFQGTVPTLTRYLDRDVKKTRAAILWGSGAALLTYIVWHWLILGIIPKEGLLASLETGDTAVMPLKDSIQNQAVFVISEFFSFFALVTSFLGVTLGLRDFLADGLNVEKTRLGRLFLCLLIFVPVLIVGALYPGIFIEALQLAGGFGTALLLGLLPICMTWAGRYHLGFEDHSLVRGGKPVLVLMALFVLIEVSFEVLHLLHMY